MSLEIFNGIKKKLYVAIAVFCCAVGCKMGHKISMPNNKFELNASWQLIYLLGKVYVDSLYHQKIPYINVDLKLSRISGNTGCNDFSGLLNIKGNSVHFSGSLALTKMMCLEANDEQLFLDAIKKADGWSITGRDTLNLLSESAIVIKFERITSHTKKINFNP